MVICDVSLDEVWKLRQQVMYPDQEIEAVELENDVNGVHMGLYTEN